MANIKKLPLFVRCVIQNFPFIEEDFDALTNYQLTCKVVEFLNKVISSQNEVINVTNDLQDSFINLQNYVENYFDNLDIQEELNNKIDAMAEDGTLQQLLLNYSNVSYVADTFDSIDSGLLITNARIKTLGYHEINDGGSCQYIVKDTQPSSGYYETVGTKYLLAIINDSINVKQCGAYGDGTHDDTTALQNAINSEYNVYIPSGDYLTSSTLVIPFQKEIIGENRKNTSIIANFNSDFILQYGSSYDYNGYAGSIKDIALKTTKDSSKPNGIYLYSACKIECVDFYRIGKTIDRVSNYIDLITIDNVYIGYCTHPTNDYLINLGGNADAFIINQLKIATDETDLTEYNGIYISTVHGGEISNSIINCNLTLSNVSAFSINNSHMEGTGFSIILKTGYVSINNFFKFKNNYDQNADIIFTEPTYSKFTTLELNNVIFGKNGATYGDVYSYDISELYPNTLIKIKNAYEIANFADLGTSSLNTNGIKIQNQTEFNTLSGYYSKECLLNSNGIINPAYTNIKDSSTSMGTVALSNLIKWKDGNTAAIYYRIACICDETRKVITTLSNESSATDIVYNSNGVVIAVNKSQFNRDLIIFKGLTSGNYTKKSIVNAVERGRIFDNGPSVNGRAWEDIETITSVPSAYTQVDKFEKIENNVRIWKNTTPTTGTWTKGDIVENTNITSGQVIRWIYDGTNWVSQGTY